MRRGDPRRARLSVVETLRAAAPWQALRRAERAVADGADGADAARVQVRPEDFRVRRFRHRSESIVVFAVDVSGSAALHRLGEAKGAVELLLADCYVRRDRVALVGFRGEGAELLLPATRSLARARRSLAGLPAGGGTPLAAGIDCAMTVAEGARRQGQVPLLVLLTDGRANIARDGSPGRARAGEDALAAARAVRLAGVPALLVDTSPRPAPLAGQIADAMGGTYLALPGADARTLSQVVRGALPDDARGGRG